MATAKVLKDGQVNHKKRLKFCAECSTWISYVKWAKHKQEHEQNSKQQEQEWMPREKTPLEREYDKLREDHKKLESQYYCMEKEVKEIRQVAYGLGRLITVLYEY